MKTALIISPYFPPVNAADMQRVRMSLPYFKEYGWDVEVVVVDEKYVDMIKDPLLTLSIPNDIVIHRVSALPKKVTKKIGLGSISLRSIWQYKSKVNKLLKSKKYDLVYFSTTQFPLLILGAYWKIKFDVPYVIDMQDPWHTDYYQNKPKEERPPKYWFSYRLNKFLEPLAMKNVDGLISVSQAYLTDLENRYSNLKKIPKTVITFGASTVDFDIAKLANDNLILDNSKINFVYVGVVGNIMRKSLTLLFLAYKHGLITNNKLFGRIHFYFLGTSYAPNGHGKASVMPIADEIDVNNYVTEQTNRIPFYAAIKTLQHADVLMMFGSDDAKYTASKIYPYILAKKPMIGIFHPKSSAINIIKECSEGKVIPLEEINDELIHHTYLELKELAESYKFDRQINWNNFKQYTAEKRAQLQCELFNNVISAV